MLQQIITSFLASASFGILFNVPRAALIKCGFTGMVGWMFYYVLTMNDVNLVLANLVGAFWVAVISHFFAKRYRTPVIIFSVCGVIPLVPGGIAYDAMRHFVMNEYDAALALGAKVLLMSGAIAIGLVISEVINQFARQWNSVRGKAKG